MRSLSLLLLATIPLVSPLTAADQPKTKPTAQAERGRELFLQSSKGKPCGTCHTMIGLGTHVGPDLTQMATYAQPRGFVTAMRMSMTETVQLVKPAIGDSFPGVMKQKNGDKIEVWDLSQMPPLLRTLASSEVTSMTRDDKWKHPPSTAGYSAQELADIVAFMKWAATGSTSEVKVEDIETSK